MKGERKRRKEKGSEERVVGEREMVYISCEAKNIKFLLSL